MTSFAAFSDHQLLPGSDPFESILTTARGIGFLIPEPLKNSEDVQRTCSLENIDRLLEANESFPVLQVALDALQCDMSFNGFLNIEKIKSQKQRLEAAIDTFQEFSTEKTVIMEQLMGENDSNNIPVELDCQAEFKNLMNVIARDQYKLVGLLSHLREFEGWGDSPISWQSHLQELRSIQKCLEASNKALNNLTYDIKKQFMK